MFIPSDLLDRPVIQRGQVLYPFGDSIWASRSGETREMLEVPVIETERLRIREFERRDAADVNRIMRASFGASDETLTTTEQWLEWTMLGYRQHARLYQPPYGERAIELRNGNTLIGICGYVPSFDAFGQIEALAAPGLPTPGAFSPEFGLFWAIEPAYRGKGYATEAANGLIEHAFSVLSLRRIIATTEYDNAPSIAVMRRLGMTILRNPLPTPEWLQIVGVLENPRFLASFSD
jgi:[ribosomal protein S5]-alanine N-acetyltransferase